MVLSQIRPGCFPLLAVLLAVPSPGQWPRLPDRPGQAERTQPGAQEQPARRPGRRPPGRPHPVQRARQFLRPDVVPGPGAEFRGTASRTGTGLGLWEALTAIARTEGERAGQAGDLAPRPDRSLLLRYGDEVALRAPEEQGWEVVYWWRKTRILSPGHQLRLRRWGRCRFCDRSRFGLRLFHRGLFVRGWRRRARNGQ